MLLLVTILLVVVGTISLVIGFLQSALLPIYISIACSVLAAVVLLVFSRMTAKSQQTVTAGDGPAPLDPGGDRDRERTTEREPAFAGPGLAAGSSGTETFAPDTPTGARYSGLEDEDEPVVDDDFPIERYDSRRVGEILPLLAELDLDELDIVREHEEQGKSRATVLARIDQLIDQLEAEDRQEASSRFGATDVEDTDTGFRDDAGPDLDDDLEDDDADHGFAPSPPAPPLPTQAVTVAALPEDDGYFPIEEYDDLRTSEILPLLPELDDDELEMVRAREQAGAARTSILRRIDVLAGSPEPEAEPEPMAPVAPVPAVVPEVPAKRAPSKRAPAAKKAPLPAPPVPPAKKAPATKRTSRVTAAVPPPAPPVKKAVKKSGPTKAAAKKGAPLATSVVTTTGPAKKAPIDKDPIGKSAAAKKSPAEKVASAKRTASKAGGAPAAAKSSTKAAKATRKTTKS